jgi:hypothetical protein
MRFRASALTVALCVSLFLLACNSKPTGANGSPDNNAANNPSSSSAPNPSASTDNNAAPPADSKTAMKAAAPLPPPVVPAGTRITIRLAQAVGSKISQPGEAFSGAVAAPVEVNGQTVIPSGATASGTVVDAKALGHFAGGARLELKLNSINISGADQPVETSSITQVIKGKGKRTGIMAGGGAGLGAIIGGIAGGGKGAAIGALAGAGAGTAGGALTGNKEIVLPAESAVTFKLTHDLELK